MVTETGITAMLVASAAGALFARISSTFAPIPKLHLTDDAVGEERLRVRADRLEEYLRLYGEWYWPVDCWSDPERELTSGRELLAVLLREYGDEYNLVFLFRYEDAFKRDYYTKYARAFLEVHGPRLFPDGLDELRAQCERGRVPEEVAEAIRELDRRFRDMVELDEATWNRRVDMSTFHEEAGSKSG